MAGAAEPCPHCGQPVDVRRQDVGDGLLACEHCGELFSRKTPAEAVAHARAVPDIIGALYGEPEPEPAPIRVAPEDALGHRPAVPPPPAVEAPVVFRPPRRRGMFATLVWTLGILILLLALAGQFAYFMRDELARHAPLRPWLMQLCDYAGCEIPLLRAPAQIRMVARDIRRHPMARDALRVSLTFANDAAFAQAYPIIQLSFFDLRDRVLAQRRFTPQEYLPQNIDMTAGIPAHGALQTVIEIVDPGAEAVNFTFDFF